VANYLLIGILLGKNNPKQSDNVSLTGYIQYKIMLQPDGPVSITYSTYDIKEHSI
jgi:hypothetical protein